MDQADDAEPGALLEDERNGAATADDSAEDDPVYAEWTSTPEKVAELRESVRAALAEYDADPSSGFDLDEAFDHLEEEWQAARQAAE